MKIGAENKKKLIWMAALLAIALAVGVYNFRDFFGGSTAAAPPSISITSAQQKRTASVQDVTQDPRLRLDILDTSRKVKYEPGRDIFHMQAPPPPKIESSVRATPTPIPTPVGPTPTPPPPPIPLKYFGFATSVGEPRKVFLSDEKGERPFVVGQGEIVDRRYRLVQIQVSQVIMEDVLTNHRQAIPLTERH